MTDYAWAVVIYFVATLSFAALGLFFVLRELPPKR